MIDFHRQAFVAQADRRCGGHVDEIPGDVAGFVHGAQLGHGLGRAFVPGHGDLGMLFEVGLDIGFALAGLVGTAPRDDGHLVGHFHVALRKGGARSHSGRSANGQGLGQFHTVLPSLDPFGFFRPRVRV